MDNATFECFGDPAEKEGAGALTDGERVELQTLYTLSESQEDVRDQWERTCQRHWDAATD